MSGTVRKGYVYYSINNILMYGVEIWRPKEHEKGQNKFKKETLGLNWNIRLYCQEIKRQLLKIETDRREIRFKKKIGEK